MSIRSVLAAATVAACLLPCVSQAQEQEHGMVQMQRDVTWKLALEIAQGAIEACAKRDVPISVAVVDRAGRVRVFIASDNPTPHSLELARRKAYTARTFRKSTLEWRDSSEPGKENFGQRQLADVIALGGGYPINVGNDTIGAVGVSGNSQAGDEGCAKAGVDKVADQLK
jgi:uncharacterized protein GlcG (DUF336 family)